MMTIKEAAAVWGITERRVNELCKAGRISGAYKDGRQWMIPAYARKPVDKRMKHPQPEAAEKRKKRLPLPIGISDYRKASCEYYYVDKTLLLRDFLDERPQVSLFTRPRRFGKTLNMDMIRTYFEKTDEDTSVYFRDKKIWSCGEEYRRYQGKYPVIYVTFKDVKCETWETTFDMISKILRNEFERHSELLESDRISPFEKKYITSVLNGDADENDIALSLLNLSRMLHSHHGTAPIIIIDEYDTPIQQGHMRGFYEKAIDFMRNLFSGGLKDNPHLSYGFLTGILRVAKESIFSGLNNPKINSILDDRYSEYFGFTSDEVQEMAEYYGACEKYPELCDWYDGYRFGGTEIFNPWSVIGYFNNQCRPKAFWQSTGSNDIISEVLSSATPDIMERLEALMQGKSFVTHIDTGVIYPQLQNNPSSVYSFLLVTGYLKAVNIDQPYGEDYMCEVALPNKEISFVYSKEILSQLESVIPPAAAIGIQEAIYKMDLDELQTKLEKFLLETVSFHDAASESFYHGLILGLCAMLDDRYQITSNRESGEGRFDIQMAPLSEKLPGILIELKAGNDCTEAQLASLSKTALQQINDRMYSTALKQQGVPSILKYGIAFSGKKVSIAAEIEKK
ncbi:MAG: AAA family ATPase [Anaerovoracaceae bacterium]